MCVYNNYANVYKSLGGNACLWSHLAINIGGTVKKKCAHQLYLVAYLYKHYKQFNLNLKVT